MANGMPAEARQPAADWRQQTQRSVGLYARLPGVSSKTLP